MKIRGGEREAIYVNPFVGSRRCRKILMFRATHGHLASTPTIYYIIVKVHIHRPRLMQTREIFITFSTFIGQKNKRNPTLNLFYGGNRRPPSAISMYGGRVQDPRSEGAVSGEEE